MCTLLWCNNQWTTSWGWDSDKSHIHISEQIQGSANSFLLYMLTRTNYWYYSLNLSWSLTFFCILAVQLLYFEQDPHGGYGLALQVLQLSKLWFSLFLCEIAGTSMWWSGHSNGNSGLSFYIKNLKVSCTFQRRCCYIYIKLFNIDCHHLLLNVWWCVSVILFLLAEHSARFFSLGCSWGWWFQLD